MISELLESKKEYKAVHATVADQEITLEDTTGFQIGDGVCLRAKNAHNSSQVVIKRTLVARTGNRFKLDRPLRENLWKMENATAATLCPIICGENITDCVLEKLTLDGNYAGCIFLQDCSRITVRDVTAQNYNGDGISWQICHDVRIEGCTSQNNAQLGLHPGSGSQRPIIKGNKLIGNDIGIFFCWGVKYGLAENNTIDGNRIGISIGHRDTDNLITKNEIKGSKEVGVLFRPERGKDFAGHRNRLVKNRLIDNGGDKSAAIDIQGATEAIVLEANEITDSRGSAERIGVRLGRETRDIQLKGNRIEGFAKDVVQMP